MWRSVRQFTLDEGFSSRTRIQKDRLAAVAPKSDQVSGFDASQQLASAALADEKPRDTAWGFRVNHPTSRQNL